MQGNPELWQVAGDLFVKNMDWPGAQEMAKRFRKTIDPKLLSDDDKSPELQAAEQQIQGMGQELDQLHDVLKNVQNSIEAQDVEVKQFEAKIKAYDAETKRISAVQASMSPEQIQDIVMGTVHGMMSSGELVSQMPGREGPEMGDDMMEMPPEEMPMPEQGMAEEMPEEMPMQEMPQ